MEREEWKISVIGKGGVGTSTFTIQHIQHMFIIEYDPTIGEDCYRKQSEIDGKQCLYELIDVIFDNEYTAYRDQIMRNSHGFIVAYSITDVDSFQLVNDIMDMIVRIRDIDSISQVPVVLIETKCDLVQQRVVSTEDGKALALRYGVPFFTTSAKTRINIDETVHQLVREARIRKETLLPEKKPKKAKNFKPGKKVIPNPQAVIPFVASTLLHDIETQLFDIEKYSDLTIIVENRPIHVHKSVLFSRLPSFMEKIKSDDSNIDLESSMTYPVVYSIFKYIYLGKFERHASSTDAEYKKAIMKWEVFNLLPILKGEAVAGFEPKFERLFNLNFLSDLKIIVEGTREIFCHKMVLCARSEYFRTMYSSAFREKNAAVLEVDHCSYGAMEFLIKFYYLDAHQITDDSIVSDLLKIAHRYNETQVLRMIERYLQSKLTIENVCLVLHLCSLFTLDHSLTQACEEFISYRLDKVQKTSSFKKLDTDTRAKLQASRAPGLWRVEKEKEADLILKQFKPLSI